MSPTDDEPRGLTPIERLEARGYDFDEKGRSIEQGYLGTKDPDFVADPWEWFDNRKKPDCELRCATSRELIGRAWIDPDDGIVWLRDKYRQQPLDETADPNHMVECPMHGLVPVAKQRVIDEAHSTRCTANVRCTSPNPL